MAETLTCNLISPERVLYSKEISFIACPTSKGEIGILKNHASLISTIGIGIVRIEDKEGIQKFAVDSGFLEVRDNEVSLLVSRAKTPDDIEKKGIEERIDELKGKDLGELKNLKELNWLKTQLQLVP